MKIYKALAFYFFAFSVMHQIIGQKDDLFFLRVSQLIGIFSFFLILFGKELPIILKNQSRSSLNILLVCIIGTFFVELFNARIYLLDLIYPLSFFSVSYMIVRSKPAPTPYLVIALFAFLYLLSKYIQGVPPADWVKGSRNFVSVLCIYMSVTVILVSYLHSRKLNLLAYFGVPFLGMVFSVLALGRSGIISSSLLLMVSSIFLLNESGKKAWFKYVFLFVLLIIGIVIYQNFDTIESSFLYKFEKRGVDLDERGDVISLYLNNLDYYSFLFSYPDLDFIYSTQGITLHNSYLHWHYSFGVGAIFIMLIIVVKGWRIYRTSKYVFFLLLIILIRSFSDQVLLSDGILMGLPLILIITMSDYKLTKRREI